MAVVDLRQRLLIALDDPMGMDPDDPQAADYPFTRMLKDAGTDTVIGVLPDDLRALMAALDLAEAYWATCPGVLPCEPALDAYLRASGQWVECDTGTNHD